MNRSYLILLFCFFLLVSKELAASEEQTIEYQIDKNKFAVVVVRNEGMSDKDVKELALKKAAEKTRGEKFRYFTIERQGQVQAMTPGSAPGNAPDNGQRNMYYDLIESDNFGRECFDDAQGPEANSYPAYRIIFTCYLEKPSEEAIDACDIVSCGQ